MSPSNFGDGGDSIAQKPYAADAMVFGVLFYEPGQRGISAVQPATMLGTTYRSMLRHIRITMGRGMKSMSCSGSLNLMTRALVAQQRIKCGTGAQKR